MCFEEENCFCFANFSLIYTYTNKFFLCYNISVLVFGSCIYRFSLTPIIGFKYYPCCRVLWYNKDGDRSHREGQISKTETEGGSAMTIQQCKYVLTIAQMGSFNKAAKQLFIAQSSLSGSVKALEYELGIQIFKRSSNGVYLTDDGAEFVLYATQMAEHDNFVMNRYKSEKKCKKLFISTQHYDFISDIFSELVARTAAQNYKLSLSETQTYEVIHEVEAGFSDIGIVAIKESDFGIMRRYLEKRELSFSPFLKAAPQAYVRFVHPLANCKCLSYEQLKEYPYVSYSQDKRDISFFTEVTMPGEASEKHIEISDRASLMSLLLLTDSYTVGTCIMPSALNEGQIVSIPLESEDHYLIGYILRTDRRISSMAEDFIKILLDTVRSVHGDYK